MQCSVLCIRIITILLIKKVQVNNVTKHMTYYGILYFAWEDQSYATYCILHTVLISCITVLHESYSTVMQLIMKIQYSYAENLFVECYVNNTL